MAGLFENTIQIMASNFGLTIMLMPKDTSFQSLVGMKNGLKFKTKSIFGLNFIDIKRQRTWLSNSNVIFVIKQQFKHALFAKL